MATVSLTNQNVEYHILTLFEKLDAMRHEVPQIAHRLSMQAEVRTLEFWRSIIAECLATFFYVFIVCGTNTLWATVNPIYTVAFATGFAAAMLTHCFGYVSGAHMNPAVTVAMATTRNISPLRAIMFVTAQCGGGIAGAALLYGVTAPTAQGNLGVTVVASRLTPWKGFGMEFVLSFIVVFTYFVAMDSHRKWLGNAPVAVGSSYLACAIVAAPFTGASFNPARSLGPAFVMNKWDDHWVYWFGPVFGGMLSGLIYEFIFNPRRHVRRPKDSIDGDSSSIHSDEDPYDELDKGAPKFHGSTYNTLRSQPPVDTYRPSLSPGGPPTPVSPAGPNNNYCPSLASASLYSAPPCKLDRVESLYGGTKSLYAKSPPLTRANLNRSQSVYTKVPSGPNGRADSGLPPRPGPLVPAQSLYPMRTSCNGNIQRAESIYGVRNVATVSRGDGGGVYGVIPVNNKNQVMAGNGGIVNVMNPVQQPRPESMYGIVVNRRQDSADSSYGSYHSGGSGNSGSYPNSNGSSTGSNAGNARILKQRNDLHSPPQSCPGSMLNTPNSVASYHSPTPQY